MSAPPTDPFSLSGRTALVNGASRGMGLEIARAFARAGASVLLGGRNAEALEAHADALAAEGGVARACVFDQTDAAETERMAAALETPPDILVNNIGARDRRALADLPEDAFAALLDAHLTAAYRLCRLLTPAMIAAGRGAILNLTSIAGPMAGPGDPGYTAAKAGLEGLTRSLAVGLAPQGVRVNAVAPGFFATEANQAMIDDPETLAFVRARVPLGRWARADEIAGAAVFLCSDAASFLTGQVITVDGGHSVKM
jgi:gluconate 5-dehydrogenase